MSHLLLRLLTCIASSIAFPLFWNVDESIESPVSVTQFGFSPRNWTQVGAGCSNPGCKPWKQGAFPTINSKTGVKFNGGVPQAGNLTLHLEEFAAGVQQWIPDKNWAGNAVLDFEAWTTVWEENIGAGSWHSRIYQNESRRLIREAHPEYNVLQVEEHAKRDFESAATEWFVKSLKLGRSLRPNAKWGFYGLPLNPVACGISKCSYDGPLGMLYREFAQRQKPIWEASSALFPSIYLPDSLQHHPRLATSYVASVVSESVHLASGLPVYPYAWHYYHSGKTLLPVEEVVAVLQNAFSGGASGIIIWGSVREHNASAPYWSWLSSVGGPATHAWCKNHSGCAI